MESGHTASQQRRNAAVFVAVALVALPVLALLAWYARSSPPPFATVAVFAGFLVWLSNFGAELSQDVFVSPDLMVVMVAVAAFRGPGSILAAAIVGLSGGLVWEVIANRDRSRRTNLLITAFNCGQFSLAAAAAAGAYYAMPHRSVFEVVGAAALAALAYAVVNITLVLLPFVLEQNERGSTWGSMATALPSFFAFGIVGALVGQLYVTLGLYSLVFLIVPSLIARRTYRSTLALREARDETIRVFLKALEVKDLYTARHTERVARFACYAGEEMGWRPNRLGELRHAALMHDIGKLAVSNQLLNKPGKLTPQEYQDIRRHNEVCVEILTQVEFLRATIPVASDRHGFFDAGTRPDHDALTGYIVAVADAFDAMTSTRAYRRALSQDVAFEELRRGKGTQFHPESVEALISAIERRGEVFGDGHEVDLVQFEVAPPVAGVGSAGLGDLQEGPEASVRAPLSSAGEPHGPRR